MILHVSSVTGNGGYKYNNYSLLIDDKICDIF